MTNKEKGSPEELAASLEQFLCFSIYSANLAFGKAYKPHFDSLGLTYPQYIALVAMKDEKSLTVSQLGEKLFLESSTLTPLLKRLEAAGYVKRQRDTRDERQVQVSLTAEGRAVFQKVFDGRGSIIDATELAPDAFIRLQRDIISLRDSLLAVTKSERQGPADPIIA